MKCRGVDSFYSWVVALSCGVVYLMLGFPARQGSLFFVEMLDRYDTNRKNASLPFALAFFMRSLSGPFAGFFGSKIGFQYVTMFGCVLGALGVGLCFLAEGIVSIDICLGILYGSGFGWASCLVPEIINQHFVNHRAKGFSVVIGVCGVLNFITPLILERLLHDYGVSGTFLIMSAIVLNGVPAAMLLVKPEERNTRCVSTIHKKKSSLQTDKKELKTAESLNCIPDSNLDTAISSKEKIQESLITNKLNSCFLIRLSALDSEESGSSLSQHTPLNKIKDLDQSETDISRESAIQIKSQDVTSVRDNYLAKEVNSDLIEMQDKMSAEDTNLNLIQGRAEKLTEEINLDLNGGIYKKFAEEVNLVSIKSSGKKLTKEANSHSNEKNVSKLTESKYKSINILWSPIFLLITFIQSSHFYVMYIPWTITVDLVRDKNITQNLEVYFVMMLALLDTIGSSVLGFVTDSGYMTVGNYGALCFSVMGFSCLLLVWVSGFPMTMTAICIFGFICGANTAAMPGIVTEFIEEEKRTMAMASRVIMYAPMSFTMSPLIGYFRGVLGSYDGLLYVMAALCLLCSINLVLLPRIKVLTKKTGEKENTEL